MKQSASKAPINLIVDQQRQQVISQLIPKVMEQLLLEIPTQSTIRSITSNLYDLIEAIKIIETQKCGACRSKFNKNRSELCTRLCCPFG